ncbi:fungal pheromone STE3G-protein-coupled receptor [Phlegmacium glaucopus]|nr:fungal pheromone STE3G-protein-coupled receptor [Phlegmacium glaucopus]
MPAPPNYVFTIFAFVAFLLCLIRFPMQLHAWNVGTHLLLAWVGISCLSLGINSIIWNHNTVNWAPVWCDISSRINIGISVAIPAINLCINRRLYLLASPTSLLPSEADMRREVVIDLAIGIGLPIIIIILSFLSQGYRFRIFEDYGCFTADFPSWVAVVISSVPPFLLELIAGIYGCLSIRAFYKRRSELNQLVSNHRNLDSNRYIRLMCFSIFDVLSGTPITFFYLYLAIMGREPFPGLKKEHQDFSYVGLVPATSWRSTTIGELAIFVFFGIFGFTQESVNNYRAALHAVVQFFRTTTGIKSRPRSSKAEGITFKAATRDLSGHSAMV